MTDTDAGAPAGAQEAAGPRIQVLTQYVKDLSYENPGAPGNLGAGKRPAVDLGIDVQARSGQNAVFEVTLKINVKGEIDDKPAFMIELVYAGLFRIEGIPQEHLQPFVLIECPRMLFPFARRLVADLTSDGGMPPLLLDPIDFAAIYRAQAAQRGAEGGATVGTA